MKTTQGTDRRRRVLHFIESDGVYGAERVIINLAREMRSDGNYFPVIGCIAQDAEKPVDLVELARSLGIEAHSIEIRNALVWRDLFRARRQVRALNIDIIHTHGYKPAVFAYLMRKLTGIRLVATCHLWFVDKDAPWKMRMMIAIEKMLYRHYPAVVAVSDDILGILVESGAKRERLSLIRNGVALSDYQPSTGSSNSGTIQVLNVARLTQQKAQRDLITAAAAIASTRRDILVSIVGEGELRESLQRQIDELGVGDVVRLLGFRADVADLLQQADIFVLPSVDEGMPVSLLEAVASRVPVIVTPVGDVPKLIRDGDTGMIVQPQEPQALAAALVRLADDGVLRTELAERAWKFLRATYSSQQMFEEYQRIYEGVMGRPSAPLMSQPARRASES